MIKKPEKGKVGVSRDVKGNRQENVEQDRRFFDAMADAYAYCRMVHENGQAQDWVFLSVNTSFEKLTGLKGIAGKNATEVIPDIRKTHAGLLETCSRVSLGGQPEKFEIFLESLGAWCSISVFSPEREHFAAIFNVITESKQVEIKLRESMEYFRTVANFTYDWEYWLDDNHQVLYTSPSCERITGHDAAEFERDPSLLEKIIHPADRPLYQHHILEEFQKTEPVSLDFRILTANGEVRWISHACQRVYGTDGRPMGRRASNRDITQRRQMEQALRESESILSMSEEVAQTGSWRLDLRTQKAAWSDQMFRLFEMKREDFDGDMNRLIVERVHPDDAESVLDFNRSILTGISSVAAIAYRIVLPDGRERAVRAQGKLVYDDAGQPVSMAGYVREVTEWMRVKNELLWSKRLYAALSQVNKTIAQVKGLAELYPSICEAVVKQGEIAAAWIEMLDESSGELRPVAASRLDLKKWLLPVVNFNEELPQNGLALEAFRAARVVTSGNAQADERTKSLRKHLAKLEFHSLASIPLELQGKTIGVLNLASGDEGLFKTEEEISLLGEMGLDISSALDRLEDEKNRHRWEDAFEHSPHGIVICLPTGRILACNPAFARSQGYTVEEISSMSILDMYHASQREYVGQHVAEADNIGRIQYEAWMTRKNGSVYPIQMDLVSVRDEDGNLLYRIATQQDEQAQGTLHENEKQMRSIFRVAPTGIGIVRDRILMDVNTRICEMTGYAREELIGQSARILYPTQEDFDFVGQEKYRQIAEKGTGQVETRWQKKDGSILHILLASTPIDNADHSRGVAFTAHDITDRKRAEEALRESEDKFKYVFDNSTVAKSITKINGTLHPNQAFCEMTGYSEEELNNKPWREITHPDDIDLNIRELDEILAGQKELARFIKRYIHKNGGIVWVDLSTSLRRDADGNPLYFVTTALDITERRHAEEALRESEERLRLAHKATRDVIWDWDVINDIQRWNEAGTVVFGWTESVEGTVNARWWVERIHPGDRQRVEAGFFAVVNNPDAESWRDEYRFLKSDGSYAIVMDRGFVLRDTHGKAFRMVGAMQDITERKQAEEALQQEQLFSKLVIDSLPGIFYLYTYPEHRLVLWNKQHETLLGFSGEEIKDRFVADWHVPQARDAVFKAIEEVMEKGQSSVESPLVAKDGHLIPFFLTGVKFEAQGRLFYMGIGIDITERKQAEEALRESEDKFKYVFDNSTVAKSITKINGTLHPNQAFCEMTGYSEEELNNKPWREITHPDDVDLSVRELDEILAGQKESARFIKRYIHKNGGIVWVDLSTSLRRDTDGKPLYFITTALDITERKRAEEALRESEDKFRKAFMTSPDSVNINQLQDGMYISINPGFTQIMGYTEADVLGKTSLDLHIWENPEDRARLVEGLRKDGFVNNLEARFHRKDGGTKYGLMSAAVIELGGIPHILSITRDITERKQAEEAIRQSERQMRALLTSLDDIVFEFDGEGTYLNIWAADENLLAMPKAKMLGKNILEVMGREQGTPFDDVIKRSLADNIPQSIEYPLEVIGGRRWFMARVSPILSPEGSTRTVSVLVRDITERKQIEEQVQVQLRRVRALNEIDRAISSSLDMRLSLDILLTETLSQLGVDAACVLLLNPSLQALEYSTGKGFRSTTIRGSRILLGHGFPGQAGLERKTIHVPNIEAAEDDLSRRKLIKEEKFVEYLCVPLIAKGLLKGVLEVFNRTPLNPDMEWMNYLETLGGQAAIAIDNAQLFEGMQRSNLELVAAYDATIEGWSRAMDLRDKETEGHTLRVTEWTVKLANAMGASPQEIVHMRRGALLHDIGKLGVPDHILHKPEGLDQLEWEIMRQHPAYAFDMLLPIAYLRPALDIPYCHHEKWDGSGYPRGLKGEEIPLAARIFAVVDVWDALHSDRPYRKGWTIEKICKHLMAESGRHFDPRVVDAFLQILEDEQ